MQLKRRSNLQKCRLCGKELNGIISFYTKDWFCSDCKKDDILCAERGCKVKVVTLNAGYEHEEKEAKSLFQLGDIYTVESVEVGSWSSEIELKEFPNKKFNSVFFGRV